MSIVECHGDAYGDIFTVSSHLVTLCFATVALFQPSSLLDILGGDSSNHMNGQTSFLNGDVPPTSNNPSNDLLGLFGGDPPVGENDAIHALSTFVKLFKCKSKEFNHV